MNADDGRDTRSAEGARNIHEHDHRALCLYINLSIIVSHVPSEFLRIFWLFLHGHGGRISCMLLEEGRTGSSCVYTCWLGENDSEDEVDTASEMWACTPVHTTLICQLSHKNH